MPLPAPAPRRLEDEQEQLSSPARYTFMSMLGGFLLSCRRIERRVATTRPERDAAGPDALGEERRRDVKTLFGCGPGPAISTP